MSENHWTLSSSLDFIFKESSRKSCRNRRPYSHRSSSESCWRWRPGPLLEKLLTNWRILSVLPSLDTMEHIQIRSQNIFKYLIKSWSQTWHELGLLPQVVEVHFNDPAERSRARLLLTVQQEVVLHQNLLVWITGKCNQRNVFYFNNKFLQLNKAGRSQKTRMSKDLSVPCKRQIIQLIPWIWWRCQV